MQLIRNVAAERYAQLELNALVQRVVVTNHRREAAEELANRWMQLSPDEILESPYVLIGTVDQLIEDLQVRQERWGISYYVVFEPYMDAFAPVVARLAGSVIAVTDHDLIEMAGPRNAGTLLSPPRTEISGRSQVATRAWRLRGS